MNSDATTAKAYIDSLAADRAKVIRKLRTHIRRGLPTGFKEQMSYGMIGYVVPLSVYPAGYHVKAGTPLPFINLASQKNHVAIYHMGLYADSDLLSWFSAEYALLDAGKLDMGKCCIRFRKLDNIPFDLLEELAGKLTTAQWIKQYEKSVGRH